MKYRQLGSSDLKVSEISLGSWLTYGVGVERDSAAACVDAAFDLGINFIDTANVYGRGAAESVLGEILAGRARDSYVLATKVYFPMSDTDTGLSAAQIGKQIDASLTRLKTDHVDLYQCHRYDADTPLEETMAALSEVVRSGKARYIGFSEWSAPQIQAAADLPGMERFVSSQPQYSLLWRRPEEKVIPLSAATGVSQIVWSPLAQGVLSGKYAPGHKPPADSRAASQSMGQMMNNWLKPEILEAVEKVKPIAAEAGCSMSQFALAWVLREPNVASAIVGASRPAQLAENAAASGMVIDPELFCRAEGIVAGIGRG
jgi:aryl-alcohol dehydrogenase-like predicted oxidoreductase